MTHTVDRTLLWQVQTPQLFVFSVLLQAHWAVSPQFEATDDAQLVELAKLGSVVIKPTSPWNLKLTTWQDYQLLQTVV
jgi:2-C-methyl-D-erythritol 4-phosphate cytidylyltransferase